MRAEFVGSTTFALVDDVEPDLASALYAHVAQQERRRHVDRAPVRAWCCDHKGVEHDDATPTEQTAGFRPSAVVPAWPALSPGVSPSAAPATCVYFHSASPAAIEPQPLVDVAALAFLQVYLPCTIYSEYIIIASLI